MSRCSSSAMSPVRWDLISVTAWIDVCHMTAGGISILTRSGFWRSLSRCSLIGRNGEFYFNLPARWCLNFWSKSIVNCLHKTCNVVLWYSPVAVDSIEGEGKFLPSASSLRHRDIALEFLLKKKEKFVALSTIFFNPLLFILLSTSFFLISFTFVKNKEIRNKKHFYSIYFLLSI